MNNVPMHFITGFLGSGKTTLINSLLKTAGTKKIGLLLNDFGSICIDDTLTDFNNGITQIGLSGGQIFCACLAGSFVKSVLSFKDLDLDCVLIEASGLAKPNTLFDIVSAIEKQSDRGFVYGSTSCIIDAVTFEKLLQSVNAIKEQALTADKFFITKLDDKTELDKNRIQCILQEINPIAPIEVVVDKSINWDVFDLFPLEEKLKGKAKLSYKTWGDFSRPITGKAEFKKLVSFNDVSTFLSDIAPDVLRAKGFVDTSDRGILFCEIASNMVVFKESDKTISLNTIILIKKHDVELKSSKQDSISISWD